MLDLTGKSITLVGIDCNHVEQLIRAIDFSSAQVKFSDVKILTDKTLADERIVLIEKLTSAQMYNYFVIKKLADYIKTDYFLLIQHDGYIQNSLAWTDEFLNYDYIGAPWDYPDKINVGNGGFSLRSKRLMNLLQSMDEVTQTFPEDQHICRTYKKLLEEKGIKFAPEKLAARFSLEGNHRYGFTYGGQFGFHDHNLTIGIRTFYKLSKVSLIAIIKKAVDRMHSVSSKCSIKFKVQNVDFLDTVEIKEEYFINFLNTFVFAPLLKIDIIGELFFEVCLLDRGDVIALFVVQDLLQSSFTVLRQGKSNIKDGVNIILKVAIPKKQRL